MTPIQTQQRKYKLKLSTRKKMSIAHQGKHHSPETIEKITAAMRERSLLIQQGLLPHPQHSAATKRKISRAMRKRKPVAAIKARVAYGKDKRLTKQELRRMKGD